MLRPSPSPSPSLQLGLFLLSLFLYAYLPPAIAFPDNLYGPVGCSTDLSTDEVIMNSYITAYEKSRDPDITTVVLAPDGMTILESPIVVSKVPMTVTMIVRNPNNLGGVQYAMDVVTENAGASFQHGQCDGKTRVGGRPGDHHILTIDKIPDEKSPIRVWAGWACGHEAVTLTNYFEFTKPGAADANANANNVDMLVEKVLDLEQADQHERKDLVAELGDDEAANAGDFEEQLDKMNADPEIRTNLERVFQNRAQWQNKDENARLPHQNLDKYKDLMLEKKQAAFGSVKDEDWDQVKKRLALSGKSDAILRETKMVEHHRLMQERRDRMAKDNPHLDTRALNDMARRSGFIKERFEERKSLLAHKIKAPLPNDAEEAEVVIESDQDPVRQRGRGAYEDQDSDILMKEVLMGLLGVLVANWFIVQLCLWNDKRKKGRRDL